MANVTRLDHPLIDDKLARLRDRDTQPLAFRALVRQLSAILAVEATRDLRTEPYQLETPVTRTEGQRLRNGLVLASVLRAGNGMLDGFLDILPEAEVAHIGLYRDADSLQAVEYYFRAPGDLESKDVVVLDPMLATANTAIAALQKLRDAGAKRLRMVSLLAAPEGLEALERAQPNLAVFVGAIDERLNGHGYIVPGLGDAGDRLYGTH